MRALLFIKNRKVKVDILFPFKFKLFACECAKYGSLLLAVSITASRRGHALVHFHVIPLSTGVFPHLTPQTRRTHTSGYLNLTTSPRGQNITKLLKSNYCKPCKKKIRVYLLNKNFESSPSSFHSLRMLLLLLHTAGH